jgi:hypothetical protein
MKTRLHHNSRRLEVVHHEAPQHTFPMLVQRIPSIAILPAVACVSGCP